MKVQVLMSTYNGEKYIKRQIDSIFNQEDVDVVLMIRDDGSTDRTVDIINSCNDKRIKLEKGRNIGPADSFYELIQSADVYDFYALSDQDDVWDKDKLSIAIKSINEYDGKPVLYSSNTKLVDENLNFITVETLEPKTDLTSALIKNYATGCTVVFNAQLIEYLKEYHPVNVKNHDWWMNLVALSVGGISIYDVSPHVNYRQHENNVVGATNNSWYKLKRRIKKTIFTPYKRNNMARQLITVYGDRITEDSKNVLLLFQESKKQKFAIIRNGKITTGDKRIDYLFKLCVLLGKI